MIKVLLFGEEHIFGEEVVEEFKKVYTDKKVFKVLGPCCIHGNMGYCEACDYEAFEDIYENCSPIDK